MQAYLALEKKFADAHHLNDAFSFLHWDYEVMMPQGGAQSRGEQLAVLSRIQHQILTENEVSDLLDEAENETANLDAWQKRNLQLMRKKWQHMNAVDGKLEEAFTIAGTECNTIWRSCRESDDFETYLPYQQKVLELSREIAVAKSSALGCSPYEALIDQYDEGRSIKELDAIFSDLQGFLPDFISNVVDHQSRHSPYEQENIFVSKEQQQFLNKKIMHVLGFDFNCGRVDSSTHPFCGGSSQDIRITTRYDEQDFLSSVMAVMHETGHALYELGLDKKWATQPVGQALGMSMHESQSLLIEMQLGRSREFLYVLANMIESVFEQQEDVWNATNLYKVYTRVNPDFIRVDADEVTYPIHVILRYNIEKQLINGNIQFKDVPELWNTQMKEMLSIDVPSYKKGCMQDIHWTDGSFGYFPSYTLGAIIAGHLFHHISQTLPDLKQQLKEGSVKPLVSWLHDNIHRNASLLPINDLLRQSTGEAMNVDIYKNYLKNKYLY